jgi:energy-coupling factor transporter transmembrane protein EcfT
MTGNELLTRLDIRNGKVVVMPRIIAIFILLCVLPIFILLLLICIIYVLLALPIKTLLLIAQQFKAIFLYMKCHLYARCVHGQQAKLIKLFERAEVSNA